MKAIFTLLALGLAAASQAQSPVAGRLQSAGKPVANATVQLLLAKDSSLLKAAITDADGRFELLTSLPDSLLLRFQSLGYETIYSSRFLAKAPPALASVEINRQDGKLQGVTVVAKKPLFEVKADKTVFNVENSINATGSNALELLQKSPGVLVDNNDNITMKGKTGVRVYIDGKMQQLDAKDLAAYLRSLNSSDIEAIEMISNPSAKYDASGNAGIVNIRLKKNKKYGTNGSVATTLTQGVTPKANGSLNLNYRDKKINIYGNASGNVGYNQNEINLYRDQRDTLFDQRGRMRSEETSYNLKSGLDLFLNSRNTIGIMANANLQDGLWRSDSHTDIFGVKTGNFVRQLDASNVIDGYRINANANANYKYLDTSGTEINVDADYGRFQGRRNSFQPNVYRNAAGNLLYSVVNRNIMPTDIYIYTLKADAEIKAWKGKLGFGAKTAFVNTDNALDFYNIEGGKEERQLSRSNSFSYLENVNAAYVNFNRGFGEKWSVQGGVRMEQTNSRGELQRADGIVQPDNLVKRSYLDWFPSAAITYNLNKKHSLNLAYSRRIDRPGYQDLNPFEIKLDELAFMKGNAFLRPQYTDNLGLTHTFLGMVNTNVSYSYVKDFTTQVTDTAGNATFIQERNLANQQILNFSVSSPTPINKWWSGFANLWGNYQIYQGMFNNGAIDTRIWTYGGYVQQTFNLGKEFSAELSGWFNGPSIWGGTWRNKAQGAVDAGVQKMLWNKSATVKLQVTDIFFTAPWRAVSNFGGSNIRGNGNWESQTLRLSFNYRFGSNQIKANRQRKSGLESEAGRIK